MQGRIRRGALVGGLLLVAVLAGCVNLQHQRAAAKAAPPRTTAPVAHEDFVAQAADFVSLHRMTAVRGFFVGNRLGHLAQALAIARANQGGTYPVGTILQLVPQEAMVKRAPGFSPGTGDWEFFQLTTTTAGTSIRTRGGVAVVNRFGSSCASCHRAADPKFDFVCEHDHGCQPLPVSDAVIRAVQLADPRPR